VRSQSENNSNRPFRSPEDTFRRDIFSLFVIVSLPVGILWSVFIHSNVPDDYLVPLCAVTFVASYILTDVTNQALAVLYQAPFVMSLVQGTVTTLLLGIWAVAFNYDQLRTMPMRPLLWWLPANLMFAFVFLAGRLAHWRISLGVLTVFLNLSVPVMYVAERVVMPPDLQPQIGFWSRLALLSMIAGATLFSIQMPSFNVVSLGYASLFVGMFVVMRLAQRFCIVQCLEIPVAVLSCADCFTCAVCSLLVSLVSYPIVVPLSTSLILLTALSCVATAVLHMMGLLLVRSMSATNSTIAQVLGNVLVIVLGVAFYNEKSFNSPLAILGLVINLAGGCWYGLANKPPPLLLSLLASESSEADPSKPGATSATQ
jgi:hypothetical protein